MNRYALYAYLGIFLILFSCSEDDIPEEENLPEVITNVNLTFTPDGGGDVVTAAAVDPDGEGGDPLMVTQDIVLAANTSYRLSIGVFNSIANEDVREEIEMEDDDHQLFFEWTEGAFPTPGGNGNTDNRNDAVGYQDFDDANLPLGLETDWTTGAASTGTFRVVLKHQPNNQKSETSTVNTGDTDFNIVWNLTIQ